MSNPPPPGAPKWDDTRSGAWPENFAEVDIPSRRDGEIQKAYLFRATAKRRPLVISLHTWSADYTQKDPLAPLAVEKDWNYCHPDFRGRNNRPEACLSPGAVDDLQDAVDFARDATGADAENVFVAGVSGGGHAALGAYLKTSGVKAVLSWVPISDLEAWYWQSLSRGGHYAKDVLQCVSTDAHFDAAEARRRSPLHWAPPAGPLPRLEISAGIEDGTTGSVPVSHSILFFNKMVRHFGRDSDAVDERELSAILSRGLPDLEGAEPIEGRAVKFHREIEKLSLTIFQGGHEMLPRHCFQRLETLSAP